MPMRFVFASEWNGIFYPTKRVRPIFVVAADYDSDGRLAGIEILDAIRRLGDPSVLRQVILEGVGPSPPPSA
jgi:hypothetical protein